MLVDVVDVLVEVEVLVVLVDVLVLVDVVDVEVDVEVVEVDDVVVVVGGGMHPSTRLQNMFLIDVLVAITLRTAVVMLIGQIAVSIFCKAKDILSHVPISIQGRLGPV